MFKLPKRTFGEWKLNYIMGLMMCTISILLTKVYNTFYPEKKCLHFPPPATLPVSFPLLRQRQVEKILVK